MNIYDRLLNILAESLTPEYWQRHELIHYLKLAQSAFAYDTKLMVRRNSLLPKIKNRLSDKLRTSIPSIELEEGVYAFPEDCKDVISITWNGEQVGHKNITYLNTYSGYRDAERQGVGRRFRKNWEDMKGKPVHWINQENGIRFFPKCSERLMQIVKRLSDEDIQLIDEYYFELPEQIGKNSGFYYSVYGVGTWDRLTINEDFTIDDEFNFIPTEKLIEKIERYKKEYDYNMSFMFLEESSKAVMYYYYEPQFVDLKPINGEEGVLIETDERHHEAIANYAAYLALSKEGDKTQDLEKASVYLQRYQKEVADCRLGRSEVDIDPCNSLPFIL